MKSVNWAKIFDGVGSNYIREFANGELSGRDLYLLSYHTGASPIVRNLLRSRGVDEARKLARKALSRR